MQRLEVSGAVRLIYKSLGVKGLMHEKSQCLFTQVDRSGGCDGLRVSSEWLSATFHTVGQMISNVSPSETLHSLDL